jgi:hypothetical protein
MKSDTKNVKLGVCEITWNGKNLGYTKGGVDVAVSTSTHKVMVDQFGESEINEYILGRTIKVTTPLAETTLENLVNVMPGATLTTSGGTAATGSIQFAGQPSDGDTITIGGVAFTFKNSASAATDIAIGVDLVETVSNAAAKLNTSTDAAVSVATYSDDGVDTVSVAYDTEGVEGNSLTLATSIGTATVTDMSGGVDPLKRVDVTNAVGMSLLARAKELRLHPVANADDDYSDDFIVPLAATAGQMNFSYKLDEERIFNCEWTGYPDPTTKRVFRVGDPNA